MSKNNLKPAREFLYQDGSKKAKKKNPHKIWVPFVCSSTRVDRSYRIWESPQKSRLRILPEHVNLVSGLCVGLVRGRN